MVARQTLCLALAFGVLAVAFGLPSQSRLPQPPTKPKDGDNYGDWRSELVNVVSDIKLTEMQMKSGIKGENYRWRQGFYVQIDSRFSGDEYNAVNNALYELSTHLCIEVLLWPQDASPTGDYVFINKGDGGSGCWSYVGKLGGRQELNLQTPGCNSVGTIMHEAIHALGYYHEQSRPDRDDHVAIHLGNAQAGTEHNFNKYGYDHVETFNVGYDINSIMHYGGYDFSSNGQPTITAHNGAQVGSRGALTGNDVAKLKAMYC